MHGEITKRMEAAGYRFVGAHGHSAIKICTWCRTSMRLRGNCYKEQFYGISSHRCVQMSPAVFACSQNCLFCWRPLRFSLPSPAQQWDSPAELVDGCIEAQKKILQGFGANSGAESRKKFHEAVHPKHFAISLSGEPTMYPHLGDMIEEIHRRNMTTFLVTNGTLPERVQSLLDNNQQPTQFYVTVAAPNEQVLKRTCAPFFGDAWGRLNKTLSIMNQFDRSVMRLTLVKNLNLVEPRQYAELADKYAPDFLEVKAFMSVGGARERIPYEDMPSMQEIEEFAGAIAKWSSYDIADVNKESRVVMLTREKSVRKLIAE